MSDHITLAREYIEQGEEFYAKAADEMAAAFNEGMTHTAIATAIGRSHDWVRSLIRWREANGPGGPNASDPLPTPFAGQYEDRIKRAGKQAMQNPEMAADAIKQASPEQRKQIVESLMQEPEIRVQAAAASDAAVPRYCRATRGGWRN